MKEHYDPSILCAVLLFGAVLVSPAFADMKKVDEAELARANASVTGASIKEPIASMDKDVVRPETAVTFDNKERVFSPVASKAEVLSVDMNISGQTTFQFYRGATNSIITGPGVTPAKH